MRYGPMGIITRHRGAMQARITVVAGLLVALITGWQPASAQSLAPSNSILARADDPPTPAPDPQDDALDLLRQYMSTLCIVIRCTPFDAKADTPSATDALRSQVAARARDQIDAYAQSGIRTGLTAQERAQGAQDAQDLIGILALHPGVLPGTLQAEYTATLESIHHDLIQ